MEHGLILELRDVLKSQANSDFYPHGTMEKIDATESTTIVENFIYYRELMDDIKWMT